MWLWAEPIIIDRAVEVYARSIDDPGTLLMARKHCRLWRTILLDQTAVISHVMDDLRHAAASLDLPGSLMDEVDDVILEELIDIVTSRYRASRNAVKTFSLVLMAATSCLGTMRPAH